MRFTMPARRWGGLNGTRDFATAISLTGKYTYIYIYNIYNIYIYILYIYILYKRKNA